MACVHFRKQQIFYGVAVFLGVLACIACGLIGEFHDVDFTGDLRAQYDQLSSTGTTLLEMNVAFVVFTSLLFLANLFRKTNTPVWFELIWSFIFGTLEIICIVLLAQQYPTAHCSPSSSSTSLTRRDTATDSTIGQAAAATPAQNVAKSAKLVCGDWAAMFVFFAMIAATLFAQWTWLAALTLRNRYAHPNFIWSYETPSPFTWRVEAPTTSDDVPVPDDASFTSSSASTLDEKKQMAAAGVTVSAPRPVQVRPAQQLHRVDFYGIQV